MNILREKACVGTYHTLQKLPLGTITAEGWLKEQLMRNKEGMGGNLDKLEPEMIATPFHNYSVFKSLPFLNSPLDPTFAAGWSGEISGTYWTGLVQLAFTLDDEELKKKAEWWVNRTLEHQEEDGYLGSFSKETDRHADYNAWASAWCYRAMLSYYEATRREDVLNAVYRGCLWFCENWKTHKTDYVGSVIIEPMSIVYAYTGDERLLTFCRDYLAFLDRESLWQNRLSNYLSEDLPYGSMHTVAYGECVKNPAIVFSVAGDQMLLKASENGLNKAVRRILHVTGGPSSSNEFLSPTGSANEVEYCNYSTYNNAYAWMTMATGNAHWADLMERSLFNGSQGARKKDERAIAYLDTPNSFYATRQSSLYAEEPDYSAYSPVYNVGCCNAHSVCLIPEYIRSMVMTDKNGEYYILCYGPASVKTDAVGFNITTAYPFRDTLTVSVTHAANAVFHFRIPDWCRAPSILLNGKPAAFTLSETGFAELQSAVSDGDTVVLKLPMEVKVRHVDDSAACSKFPLAIERGPLMYALDIPAEWRPYPGNPITPLKDGWCWFEAVPQEFTLGSDEQGMAALWNVAIDETLTPEAIQVREVDTDSYVWENPMVTLEIPLYHFKFGYMLHIWKPQEVYEVPVKVEPTPKTYPLVPYGCTNLRIAYFPRADLKKQTASSEPDR